MAKRCYILGAGFSKACGLPLASELTEMVLEYRSEQHAELGLDDPQGAIQQQRTFLRELFPQYDLETSYPDFEELMTVLDEWEDYRHACEGGTDQLIHGLKTSLIRNLHALLCDKVGEAKKTDVFKKVQDFVTRVRDQQNSIVSFNWDLLLEVAAHHKELEITYKKPVDDNTICMAKPHGSLNLADVKKET